MFDKNNKDKGQKSESICSRIQCVLEIVTKIIMLMITIATYIIYVQQRNIGQYQIEPQFVVAINQHKDFGISDEVTEAVENGEIPFQALTVENNGHYNNSIQVEEPIAVLYVDRYENGDAATGTRIPVRIKNFLLQSSYLIGSSKDSEIYRNNIYFNYMHEVTNALNKIKNSLNSEEVKQFRDGKTVQLYSDFAYYIKISYELNGKSYEKYFKVNYTGSRCIDQKEYEAAAAASEIDMLGENDLYEQLYSITRP